jgi:hypothetical protein
VFFFYDLSPIMVRYVEQRKSFLHFLTSVCAVVGGVFTVRKDCETIGRDGEGGEAWLLWRAEIAMDWGVCAGLVLSLPVLYAQMSRPPVLSTVSASNILLLSL